MLWLELGISTRMCAYQWILWVRIPKLTSIDIVVQSICRFLTWREFSCDVSTQDIPRGGQSLIEIKKQINLNQKDGKSFSSQGTKKPSWHSRAARLTDKINLPIWRIRRRQARSCICSCTRGRPRWEIDLRPTRHARCCARWHSGLNGDYISI